MCKMSSKILVFERWRHRVRPKLIFPAVEQWTPVSLGSRGFQSVGLAGQDIGSLGEGENRSYVSDVSWCTGRSTPGHSSLGTMGLTQCALLSSGSRQECCQPCTWNVSNPCPSWICASVITWKDNEMDFIILKWHQHHLTGNIRVYFPPFIF